MKKVIELIRVSTLGQAGEDRASIPAQRSVNQRTAKTFGLTITKTIEMTDVSGTQVLRTPEMQELLRLIASEDVHGVVVREFSRVMRPDNFSDYVLFQVFQDTGTLLYLPDGPLDLNSKTGKLVAGLRAIIAGNELSEIRERVWAAKEEMRRSGKNPGGHVVLPYGVDYSKEKGYFYTSEAEHVREAFRQFLSGGTSYSELGKLLGGFTPQGMHTVLTNPIYNGWRVYDKKRDMSPGARRCTPNGRQGDRRKVARDPDEVIRVKVIDPPLVSDADFRRVQEIIAVKTRRHWKHSAKRIGHFTYSGFLICSECGARMRDLQRALRRLGEIGFIRIFRTQGKRGNYHVLIHKFESTDTALSGKRLNAFKSSSWEQLVFELCADDDTGVADTDTDTAPDDATNSALRGKRLNTSKSYGCPKPASGACAESAADDDTDAGTDTARYQEEEQEKEKERRLNPSRSRSRSRADGDSDPLFQKFWSDYPRKIHKRESHSAWRALSKSDCITAVEALAAFKLCNQWREEGGKYIPSPHRFLGDRRFEDPPVERKDNAARGTRKNHGVRSGRRTRGGDGRRKSPGGIRRGDRDGTQFGDDVRPANSFPAARAIPNSGSFSVASLRRECTPFSPIPSTTAGACTTKNGT